MTPEQLLAAALAQRAQWVDLGNGKRLRFRRPSFCDTRKYLVKRDDSGEAATISADLPEIKRFVIDWDGFKECDIVIGGADDVVAFNSDLLVVWIEDQPQALAATAQAIVDAVIAYESARRDSEKN